MIKKKTPTKRPTTALAASRKRMPAKRTTITKVRRQRRVVKKKGLADLFNQTEAQQAFKQLVGVGVGMYAGEKIGPIINPTGEKNNLEIGAKIIAGFLASTTGKMPGIGAGLMASGFKKMFEVTPGLGDNGAKRVNYLADAPMVMPTGVFLNDNMNLADYTAAYQSQMY
jgi:hypothetical protein